MVSNEENKSPSLRSELDSSKPTIGNEKLDETREEPKPGTSPPQEERNRQIAAERPDV